jgi:23S rRNA (adenine2030-N6)-methyltransferase
LQQKEGGITIIDTHAGAGLYRLDGDYSETGGEATDGIFKLLSQLDEAAAKKDAKPIPEALQAYLDMIASFNPNGQAKFYPGSPFILHAMLRKMRVTNCACLNCTLPTAKPWPPTWLNWMLVAAS